MAEISEREWNERKKKKRLSRRAVLDPKNPEEMKVVFRCTRERKAKLVELAEFHKVTMTDVMVRAIDVAHRAMVERKERDGE